MKAFEYANPKTLDEAIGMLDKTRGKTEVLAGGTDLLSLMKEYVSTPDRVVNIKSIRGLGTIKTGGDEGVSIGALVTLQDLLEHEHFGHWFPSVTQAAAGVTSPQIRSMGTVGGDLLQRPRCWYYRAGFGLLATGADGESLVTRGDNRYHALFGEGPAFFVSASSLAPALAALGAVAKIKGLEGTRSVAISDLYVSPKSNDDHETVLASNEILTEVVIPTGTRNATYEVRQKEALDWPLATASVALKMDEDKVSSARIVLGHVAPTPWRAEAAEKAIAGKTVNAETAAAAGKAAVEGAKPLSRNGYKVRLTQTAVTRALLRAAATE